MCFSIPCLVNASQLILMIFIIVVLLESIHPFQLMFQSNYDWLLSVPFHPYPPRISSFGILYMTFGYTLSNKTSLLPLHIFPYLGSVRWLPIFFIGDLGAVHQLSTSVFLSNKCNIKYKIKIFQQDKTLIDSYCDRNLAEKFQLQFWL